MITENDDDELIPEHIDEIDTNSDVIEATKIETENIEFLEPQADPYPLKEVNYFFSQKLIITKLLLTCYSR